MGDLGGGSIVATYRFDERLVMSSGHIAAASIDNVLLNQIPGALSVSRASLQDDKNGTDWWVTRSCGRDLSVDAKVRSVDWRSTHPDDDDLALETWSVVERQRPGWTWDAKKQTDYILWLWRDTGRFCLVPFPMLCGVFMEHREDWSTTYRVATQFTPDSQYHSQCVFVPRKVVWRTIFTKYAGT
jgi:hypothetical protein